MSALVDKIFDEKNTPNTIIGLLKKKAVCVKPWSELRKDYYPKEHAIKTDNVNRKDKTKDDGNIEKAARLALGFEKLLVSRMASFLFAIPVKRVYTSNESEIAKEAIKAIEKVYKHARINAINLNRAKNLYAACEFFTLWYLVKEKNKKYGFDSEYKVRCRTFSPMDGTSLYPLFDEYGDMVAMSIEYEVKVDEETIRCFDTWTDNKHYHWESKSNEFKLEKEDNIEIIGKIPGVYGRRGEPLCTSDITDIRENVEYKLSEDSDTISYNSAPVLKVKGSIAGDEDKGESRRVIRVSADGDVGYVSWNQSIEATKYHVDKLIDLMFMLVQLPDISASKVMELGNVGFDARQMIFTDAHLKCGEESGLWYEVLEREFNVIKEIVKKMNNKYGEVLDSIECEHIITPFIQKDLKSVVDVLKAATGGKPLMSQKTAIQRLDVAEDTDTELEQINSEDDAQAEREKARNPLNDMFTEK